MDGTNPRQTTVSGTTGDVVAGTFEAVSATTTLMNALDIIKGRVNTTGAAVGTALDGITIGELAQMFAVRQSSAAVKDVNPNPKFEVLQQSWDATSGIMTVQTAQPVMLSSWQHPYAWPGNNTFELHATISPHAMADIYGICMPEH